jgi:hypothetical protein
MPGLITFYILAPGRLPYGNENGAMGWIKEACTFEALTTSLSFILYGFIGVGSI